MPQPSCSCLLRTRVCALFPLLLTLLLCLCSAETDQQLRRVELASKLRHSNLTSPRPPVVLIPGIASTRLIAWQRKVCRGPNINVQDIVWLNLQKALETYTYDRRCWIDCLKLGKEQADPPGCKVRADEGLDSISELAPGYFVPKATTVYSQLIQHFAEEFGYDVGSLIAVPYDWRLSPSKLEERDLLFTTLKLKLEVALKQHKRPAIVVAHSMGNLIFLYFIEWLKQTDRRWRRWLDKHIWNYVGFAAPLLGAVATLRGVLSGEPMGVPISDLQSRELVLTFASTHMLNPHSAKPASSSSSTTAGKHLHDYVGPLIVVRSSGGEEEEAEGVMGERGGGGEGIGKLERNYTVSDVESGELFRSMSKLLGDEEMNEKYNSLWRDYYNQSIALLREPPPRPPIRHVTMVYGVDLPTDAGFVYSQDKQNPKRLLLEEVWIEEPVPASEIAAASHGDDDGARSEHRVQVSGVTSRSIVNRAKRFIRHSTQPKSGDGLVPYLSLSWAHTWLNALPGETIVDLQPEKVRQTISLIQEWAPSVSSMMTSVEPAVEVHSARHSNGFTTAVLEIARVDHADILKDVYAHKAVSDRLLDQMMELCLDEACAARLGGDPDIQKLVASWWKAMF